MGVVAPTSPHPVEGIQPSKRNKLAKRALHFSPSLLLSPQRLRQQAAASMCASIYDVPYGVLDNILSACVAEDLGRAECVSRALRITASRSPLWRALATREIGDYLPLKGKKDLSWKQKYQVWTGRNFVWCSLGDAPCLPRYLHRSATTADGASYVFGGDSSRLLYFNETWMVNVIGHQVCFARMQVTGNRPPGRSACALTAMADKVFMFGGLLGFDPVTFTDDVWMFHTSTSRWALGQATGPAPCGRWGHSMVSWKNKIFVFAGSCPGSTFNDLWCLEVPDQVLHGPHADTFEVKWTQLNPENPPEARGGHAAVVCGDYMYMLGGNTLEVSFDDMWRLNLANPVAWEKVTPNGDKPSARIGHTAVAIGHHIVVYGGRDFLTQRYHRGVHLYDTRTNTWEHPTCAGREGEPRTGHAAIPCGEGVLYYGGLTESGATTSEVLLLDMLGSEQSPIPRKLRGKPPSEIYDFGSPRCFPSFTEQIVEEDEEDEPQLPSPTPIPMVDFSSEQKAMEIDTSPNTVVMTPEQPPAVELIPPQDFSRIPFRAPIRAPEAADLAHDASTTRRASNMRITRRHGRLTIPPPQLDRLTSTDSSNTNSPTIQGWFMSLGGQLLECLARMSPRTVGPRTFGFREPLLRCALRLSPANAGSEDGERIQTA